MIFAQLVLYIYALIISIDTNIHASIIPLSQFPLSLNIYIYIYTYIYTYTHTHTRAHTHM